MVKWAKSPLFGAAGAICVAAWDAVTAVQFPPHWPADIHWTWVVFVGFALQSIMASLVRVRQLENTLAPKLSLVFDLERGAPFVRDKATKGGGILRIYSVGVVNSGGTVSGVGVKVMRIEPKARQEYWAHRLQLLEETDGHSLATVNRSPEPVVFFEVMSQTFKDEHNRASDPELRFAKSEIFRLPLRNSDRWFVTLAIDGDGAEPPTRFSILRNKTGQFVMQRALMQ